MLSGTGALYPRALCDLVASTKGAWIKTTQKLGCSAMTLTASEARTTRQEQAGGSLWTLIYLKIRSVQQKERYLTHGESFKISETK